MREGLRLVEQRDKEDKAKIEWRRAAAKVGFDERDCGECITFNNDQEIDEFFEELGGGSSRNTSR